jgi:D-alanine-D-alanine ligase
MKKPSKINFSIVGFLYAQYNVCMKYVGVVRGGVSDEYDVSLKTGANVLRALARDKYIPLDILITKDGEWHVNGFPSNLERATRASDVIFNALHGTYGEDGGFQRDLEHFGTPYTGSEVFASALAMNKHLAKKRFVEHGLRVPKGFMARSEDDIPSHALWVFQSLPLPYVVKPVASGSSVNVALVRKFDDLVSSLSNAVGGGGALVEEYIPGREITCAVVEDTNGDIHALSPIEIILPATKELFDYETKYHPATQEICPAHITQEETEMVQRTAMQAHRALGLRHYSRIDMVLSPRGLYILEANSLPGLSEASLLPKALDAHNIAFPEFIDHVIDLALAGK